MQRQWQSAFFLEGAAKAAKELPLFAATLLEFYQLVLGAAPSSAEGSDLEDEAARISRISCNAAGLEPL